MLFRSFLLILSLTFSCLSFAALPNWYDDFMFKDSGFSYQFIRTLGYAYEKGADLGESISTAKKITDSDFNSWYQAWNETADRINIIGTNAESNGHAVTAREAFFRASNYYRTAGFYMNAPEDREKSVASYKKSKEAFLKAISSLYYIESVRIPYEKTTLPGYLIRVGDKNAPLVIVNTGFDGTAEELYFEVGAALHDRGYNCLIIEGPGQGSVLRQQHLFFRPDWEKVITPIVDFAEKLPNINKNKIALMGISMGGYLAPRATAFEPRIKALIANGGVYDFGAAAYRMLPPELLKLIDEDPAAFNKVIKAEMQKNSDVNWFYQNGMWTFNVKTPAEFMKKIKAYTLKDIAKNIAVPTLIVNSEADTFMQGQAEELYKYVSGKKTYLLFTRKEAAESHCQMGASAISNEKILDWLDKTFKN